MEKTKSLKENPEKTVRTADGSILTGGLNIGRK
jgi:hypothetical protein